MKDIPKPLWVIAFFGGIGYASMGQASAMITSTLWGLVVLGFVFEENLIKLFAKRD